MKADKGLKMNTKRKSSKTDFFKVDIMSFALDLFVLHALNLISLFSNTDLFVLKTYLFHPCIIHTNVKDADSPNIVIGIILRWI